MSTGKEFHIRCYMHPKDTTLVFESIRLLGIAPSVHLYWRNTLVLRTQVATLYCKRKTKNINLFLFKAQLL